MRIEKDTLGEIAVPDDALYGAQTQRAVENYPISGLREHPTFIRVFIELKKAAALANRELEAMNDDTANAIVAACDRILGNFDDYRKQFVVDVFQAGAGTSFNMNVNEVIANLAKVHPNDHVNMSQSTNDVFPTALRITTLLLLNEVLPHLDALANALAAKGDEFADVIKSGHALTRRGAGHTRTRVPRIRRRHASRHEAASRRRQRAAIPRHRRNRNGHRHQYADRLSLRCR